MYVERHMGKYGDNVEGYKNGSLMMRAEHFRDKKYMLLHGTFDDHVHYHNSMMLSREFEKRDILFRQQVSRRMVN